MKRLIVVLAIILLILPVAPAATNGQDPVVTVTILYDNYAVEDHLETDWGFAALIETGDQTILFDTEYGS